MLLHCIFKDVHGCSQIDGHIFFLDPLVQELFFHKNHWFKVLSVLMEIRPEHLDVFNFRHIKYFSKPFHVCHLWAVEDWKRQTSCYARNVIAAPHQVTLREKLTLLTVHFLSFFRFFRFCFLVFLGNYSKSARFQLFEPFQKYEPGHTT